MKHVPRKIKDKYEILGIIGEGAYGVVLKARKKDSNKFVAIKHFKQTPGYCSDIDIIERELNILRSLRFENVVQLIEWFQNKKRCFLVFEYVEWNMLQVLQEHPEGLPLEHVRQLSYQLFSAIHWCHTHEIIHRDIKPENLLISKNFILKLCDFGFARFCNTHTSADYYTNYVATRWYRAPELLIGSPYGKPVDVWACGCIMAELTTGQALFAGESDIDQLYRIQKCLGPLPTKYMEAMRTNPKFEGLKFPSIHHLDTLEQHFVYLFPPDIMHLFKNTLRLYAIDRLTAEQCIQHQAFIDLNQKRLQRQDYRPKTVYSSLSISQSQIDYNNELDHIANRLSKSYDENNENQIRHRSPPLSIHDGLDSSTDISFVTSTSIIPQIKYHNNTQLTNRSSSSSHYLRSSNETSDDDNSNNILLRKKYLKNHHKQQLPVSLTLKYPSNGVLLRPKQQYPINILQTSSKDINKKLKRFSLDQQQIPESNIYRSSMAITPSHNSNLYSIHINNNQNNSLSSKQIRDEFNNEFQQQRSIIREINRDLVPNRTIDSVETTSIPQRISSKQTVIPIDQDDIVSTVSSTHQTNHHLEQQQNNKYPWNLEQRKSVYSSDNHLMNSNGYNSSFNRPFCSPIKGDYTHMNKIQRDLNHEPIKSIKLSSKQNVNIYPKTLMESNRKQQTNTGLFGVYPLARTAILHVANAIIPSSYQGQQSNRFSNTKSRHHDH